MRSKTYEVNKVLQTLLISYISPAAKYNPPPQFANWGTSFHWIAVSGSAAYGYRVPLAGKRRLALCGGDERHKERPA